MTDDPIRDIVVAHFKIMVITALIMIIAGTVALALQRWAEGIAIVGGLFKNAT